MIRLQHHVDDVVEEATPDITDSEETEVDVTIRNPHRHGQSILIVRRAIKNTSKSTGSGKVRQKSKGKLGRTCRPHKVKYGFEVQATVKHAYNLDKEKWKYFVARRNQSRN